MTDPWRQVKHDLYLTVFTTSVQVYELRVWSPQAGQRPAGTDAMTDELAAVIRRLAFVGPAAVAAAAMAVLSQAGAFLAVVEDLRRDARPEHGALYGPPLERYDSVRRDLGASIDRFAVLARPDVGIDGDYLPLVAGPDA
jgi:hypothetical protein